uniref:LytR/AlgR family response regulator transcription factor n=1 Tax=Escherichia coli TaxID=562 RepID=UPI003D9CB89E
SLDWLASRSGIDFSLIFTTSYEEYAVKAFRLAAVDYLVKPIDPLAFDTALERFKSRAKPATEQIRQLLHNLALPKEKSKVALPSFTGYS